ncbi:Putative NADPH dehydrogenase C23G7,10c [Rhizoctonia solani]|uniref:Putative NADPH dehydrogenase C23G7,10c n=1 Tax=Rhizoctonia solani TaxID=456999 RepID=A0A0K6FXX3_9AGAM|nr:Putative NADPH dehydrogenase C23G7,10c [Rhizoctonia solani]
MASRILQFFRFSSTATKDVPLTAAPAFKNIGVPGVDEYYPLNDPPIGTAYSPEDFLQNKQLPKLFTPYKIRDVEFKNRIWVSPMCQYSAVDGHMTDWHLVHLGGFATRGAGAVILEATAVTPEGRITPECTGIWSDSHIGPMKRVVDFAHGQGTAVGIQLAHAGRKASTLAPWVQGRREKAGGEGSQSAIAREVEGGWPTNVVGPSDVPFANNYPIPKPLSVDEIKSIVQAYVDAAERCKKIGFDFIEIHGAHGYLIHSFYSPISNQRTDDYGGSLPNRLRLALDIVRAVRQVWDKPLFFRLSATDWAKEEKNEQGEWVSWGIQQTLELSRLLAEEGVDLVDVSSGGNYVGQQIPVGPGYQVPFAKQIKESFPSLPVGSVGLITNPRQSEEILASGSADVLLYARELLRHADFPLFAAQELGVAVKPADQYERAWGRMLTPKD